MPHEADPYTIVYRMLWDLVENHKPLARLVQVENRLRFDKERDAIKQTVAEGDLPELRLTPQGAEYHIQSTTSSSSVIQTLQWGIATGDFRLHYSLYPVAWELLRAMSKWLSVKDNYTWNNDTFIKRVWPSEHVSGVDETDMNRGIKGWAILLTMNVDMYFKTLDMQGDN